MTILETRIDDLARGELRNRLLDMLDETRPHFIVTGNPEIVLLAHANPAYCAVVNSADLVVADGFGLVLAGLLQGRGVSRITGTDVLHELVRIARERRLAIHFELKPGGLTSPEDVRRQYADLIEDQREARIIVANHGAPKQEFWLTQHRSDFPNGRIFVGVGGALDYATGRIRRAPRLLQRAGLEWLWRLFRQPRRARRIWRAVVVFPLTVIFYRTPGI